MFASPLAIIKKALTLTWSFVLVTTLVPEILIPVYGEVKTFDGRLDASSQFVQYSTTYLIDPGSIDLTNVKFIAVADNFEADFLRNGDDDRFGGDSGDDASHFTFAEEDDDAGNDNDDDYNYDDAADDDDVDDAADDDDAFDDTVTDDLTDAQDHEQDFNENEEDFGDDMSGTFDDFTGDDDGGDTANTTDTIVIGDEGEDEDGPLGPLDIVDITEVVDGSNGEDENAETEAGEDADAGKDANNEIENLLDQVMNEINEMNDEISEEILGQEEGGDEDGGMYFDKENATEVIHKDGIEDGNVEAEGEGEDTDEPTNEYVDDDVLEEVLEEIADELNDSSSEVENIDSNSNATEYYDDDVDVDDDDYESRRRNLVSKTSTIDVLFFLEPSDCAKTSDGCDWIDLGIGMNDAMGNRQWCCTEDAMMLKMCASDQLGRMIVDARKFNGEHRFLSVPAEGNYEGSVAYPVMTTKSGSGQYSLLLANCNDYGRDVRISGEYVYKNKGGYLPGDLFDDWHFLMLLTFAYGSLLFWYGMSMKQHQDSTIGIQKWILATVFLGLLETFFAVTDYAQWNRSGYRSNAIMLLSIFIGIFKGAIARCLLIMVSLGWGVIRDSLGEQMKKIVFLGLFYSAMAFLRDVAEIIFVEEVHVLSAETEEEIYDVFTVFTLITAAIDVIVYMWILDALNGTMQYLENMNQTRKLERYLKLRLILLLSILFGLFWTVLGLVNAFMETAILKENQDWIIPGAWAANFFFILLAIAYLWRPDPNAKQLAYAMEISSNDDELGLEATTTGTLSPDAYGDLHEEEGTMVNKAVIS